ncbi:signal peptidase I [Helicobacter sp.]|uniref:signal peptidase I n=1 Tax=Helicobacter sp. TaxID=218 RepID=UPI0025BD73E0|nr:signal peptidase I [Helicobacter sp.]MCI5968054.1 signal peptidase I [Helicobacter sp.]MDY2584029.1 signal peptidase I [Helicobacter sp.]
MRNIFVKFFHFANSWIGTIVIVLGVIFFGIQAFVIPSGSMLNTLLIGDNLFVKKFSYGIPTPTIPWIELQILPDFNKNGHLFEGKRPERGDIVVFRDPNAPKIHFVKRNVAIGGDEILYTKEGLWVHFSSASNYKDTSAKSLTFNNKTFYYEPYAKHHAGVHYTDTSLDAFHQLIILQHNGEKIAMEPVRLSNGALGFHAIVKEDEYFMMGDNRNNSSDSRFWGAVPYRYIVGKPWLIYFSWDDAFNIRWERIGKSVESLEKQALKTKMES